VSRHGAPRAGVQDAVGALVFAAFLALVAVDATPGVTAADPSHSSARLTGGAPGLDEVVVPTRSVAAAGRVDPGTSTARPFLDTAVVAVAAVSLVVLVTGAARRRPGSPWHHRRRHGAVLRAPPLLLRH
jgi:hypothetical protein